MKSLQEWMIESDGKDAYDRLDGQRLLQLKQAETQIKTNIRMEIEQNCEEMSEIIGMALQGQKSTEDIKRFWNKLTESLSHSIGVNNWSV